MTWSSTRTRTGSATSAGLKAFSSGSPKNSAEPELAGATQPTACATRAPAARPRGPPGARPASRRTRPARRSGRCLPSGQLRCACGEGSPAGLAGEEGVAEDLEGPGVGLAGGAAEGVDGWPDRDVHEPGIPKCRLPAVAG